MPVLEPVNPALRHNFNMLSAEYVDLQRVLAESRALTDAPEAHGTLVGALCAARGYRLADWLGEILPSGDAHAGALDTLRAAFEATRHALHDGQMRFSPALPADDEPLEQRAAALGQWCQGFLYGLGTSAIPDAARLPGDVGEVVRDLTEITHIAVDGRESVEANESAYAELVEFVRMAVQLLFEELASAREPLPASGEALH